MTKRILLALALVVLPVVASAADRDMLLTARGRLYTVESVYAQEFAAVSTTASKFLLLTTQDGDDVTSEPIPESLASGQHSSPALAYDSESDTLFVFWERGLNNRLTTDLVFASYRNGEWSRATSIDSADFQRARGLRIGVTRRTLVNDGSGATIPELTVHAIWWNESGNGEAARYAMLTFARGEVVSTTVRDLSSYLTNLEWSRQAASPELLRQPILFESTGRDSVDIVFGNLATNKLHRVTLRPVAEGRLRVPVGIRDTPIGTPNLRTDADSRISGAASGDSIVFFAPGRTSMNYVMYQNGTWTAQRSIALNDRVTSEAAVEVLRRMVAAE